MLIDCDSCPARGTACAECAVTALLDAPPQVAWLNADEHRAIEVFGRAGFEVTVLADIPAGLAIRPARRRGRGRQRVA